MAGNSTGSVVDLAAMRALRRPAPGNGRPPRTVILQASHVRADAEVHRHIGVNDVLHLADLHEVLLTAFGFCAEPGATPWHFSPPGDRTERLAGDDHLHLHLAAEGDAVAYHFGLWDVLLTVVASYPRDDGTPRALCVGGSGSFDGSDFNPADINARLTGTATIREVLTATTPEVRDLIDRSGIFDFVPLLQALDLTAGVDLDPEVRSVLADLPVETGRQARDAFWAVVLTLACMGDERLSDEVLETTMEALGWTGDGAGFRSLCLDSLTRLASVGGYGRDSLAPVDRLDLYRALLRA